MYAELVEDVSEVFSIIILQEVMNLFIILIFEII